MVAARDLVHVNITHCDFILWNLKLRPFFIAEHCTFSDINLLSKSWNMAISDDNTDHINVEFCAEFGMTTVKIYKNMQIVERHRKVSRALVMKYQVYYGIPKEKEKLWRLVGRKLLTLITKNIEDVIYTDGRQTVREIAEVMSFVGWFDNFTRMCPLGATFIEPCTKRLTPRLKIMTLMTFKLTLTSL